MYKKEEDPKIGDRRSSSGLIAEKSCMCIQPCVGIKARREHFTWSSDATGLIIRPASALMRASH